MAKKKEPEDIDKLLDELTKNATAEGLLKDGNILKELKKRGVFPTDAAVRKVLYLAIQRDSKKWSMPIQGWPAALNFISVVFEGRIPV